MFSIQYYLFCRISLVLGRLEVAKGFHNSLMFRFQKYRPATGVNPSSNQSINEWSDPHFGLRANFWLKKVHSMPQLSIIFHSTVLICSYLTIIGRVCLTDTDTHKVLELYFTFWHVSMTFSDLATIPVTSFPGWPHMTNPAFFPCPSGSYKMRITWWEIEYPCSYIYLHWLNVIWTTVNHIWD